MQGKGARAQPLRWALSSGQQGTSRDVTHRLLLSSRHFLHACRLVLVLTPQLRALLAAAEAHPCFRAGLVQQQPELLGLLRGQRLLLMPSPQVCPSRRIPLCLASPLPGSGSVVAALLALYTPCAKLTWQLLALRRASRSCGSAGSRAWSSAPSSVSAWSMPAWSCASQGRTAASA